MKIPNLNAMKGLVGIGKAFVLAHRPEMLYGASVIASITATGLAAKGGYEAGQKVSDAELQRILMDVEASTANDFENASLNQSNRLTHKEKAELTWKCYVPAGVALLGSVGSTSGLHLVHVKDKKALVAAGLTAIEEVREDAMDWMRQIEDEFTKDMTDEEKDEMHQRLLDRQNERFNDLDEGKGSVKVINTDHELEELYLVRDAKTQRDIWSNQHRIEDALIEVNNVINGSDGVELNHFYRHAGFGTIPEGINVGWSGALVSLDWTESVRDDGRPVRVFSFRPGPTEGYDG